MPLHWRNKNLAEFGGKVPKSDARSVLNTVTIILTWYGTLCNGGGLDGVPELAGVVVGVRDADTDLTRGRQTQGVSRLHGEYDVLRQHLAVHVVVDGEGQAVGVVEVVEALAVVSGQEGVGDVVVRVWVPGAQIEVTLGSSGLRKWRG